MKRLIAAASCAVLFMLIVSTPRQHTSADAALQNDSALTGITLYFSESNGESQRVERGNGGISRLSGLLRMAGATLNTLDWRVPFPTDMDMLVLPGAATDYSGDQIARIWAYLNNGGRVLMLINPPLPQGRARGALASNSALFVLTNADYGLQPYDNVMVIQGTRTGTRDGVQTEIPFLRPTFTTDTLTAEHPISAGIDGSFLFFQARSFQLGTPDNGVLTPLIFAPEDAYGETNFAQYQQDSTFNFDIGADTASGRNALAVAYENDDTGARLVLIGDREFAANGWGFNAAPPNSTGFLNIANIQFMLQSIAWLTDTDAPEYTFPTPGATATATITPSPLPPTPTPDPNVTSTPSAGG